MRWDRIEEQWKQQRGKAMKPLRELMNDELAANVGKHEQLVETLQEKYGFVKKGKPFNELFGDEIAQSIESLPSNFKTVVLLSDVEELRHAEIAKILACPVGTVRSRLYRGRKVLQKRLLNFATVDGNILRKFEDSKDLQKGSFM